MRSSWTNIHNIMLKLCLNPNYKQVLGELSQPVITGSTPGHRVRRTVAHKGSSLLGSVQQSSSVRGKRHTTRVLYDVLNSVIDFMMIIKVSYAHVTGLYWGMAHVAKYYERYFVHWFNDMVSWISTPRKNSQLKQAKKSTLCK